MSVLTHVIITERCLTFVNFFLLYCE